VTPVPGATSPTTSHGVRSAPCPPGSTSPSAACRPRTPCSLDRRSADGGRA
jgi:hypothetical protein